MKLNKIKYDPKTNTLTVESFYYDYSYSTINLNQNKEKKIKEISVGEKIFSQNKIK